MKEDLYQQAIVDLAKRSRQQPRLDRPDRTVTVDNPLCGDRITIDLVFDETSVVSVGHKTRGCLLCEAAAYLIAEEAPGQKAAALKTKADKITSQLGKTDGSWAALWPGLETLDPVHGYKSRHDCVTLPFQALAKALQDQG